VEGAAPGPWLLLDGTGRTVQSGTALPGARVTVPAGLAPGLYHFRDATGRAVQLVIAR
jgi:hypothetical protein